jgi:hypothetical protein
VAGGRRAWAHLRHGLIGNLCIYGLVIQTKI